MNIFALLAIQDCSIRKTIGDFLNKESSKSKTPSTQALKGGFFAVVSKKEELQYRYKLILIEVLPLLANQNSNSHVKNIFRIFQKQVVCLN